MKLIPPLPYIPHHLFPIVLSSTFGRDVVHDVRISRRPARRLNHRLTSGNPTDSPSTTMSVGADTSLPASRAGHLNSFSATLQPIPSRRLPGATYIPLFYWLANGGSPSAYLCSLPRRHTRTLPTHPRTGGFKSAVTRNECYPTRSVSSPFVYYHLY